MTPEEAREREAAYRAEWEATHTAEEIAQRDADIQASIDSWERHKERDPGYVDKIRARIAELDRKYPL